MTTAADLDLVIVGGCGHVGLPLALTFAEAGCRVGVYDIDQAKVESVRGGQMPFRERGADELLPQLLAGGQLEVSNDPATVGRADVIVLVIGTPIDRHMNPSFEVFEPVVREMVPHMRTGALVVLRSTVFPGTTELVAARLQDHGIEADVVFCPERVAEGFALEENRRLPQIVGAADDIGYQRAADLFGQLDVELIRVSPQEAELAKLLTNTWRYMKFAIANQFFQIAHRTGMDYNRVLHAVRHNYPRAADLPGPGFAAGPCLFKDTMQLAAFSSDHFPMGHSAMLVNEGVPEYLIDAIEREGSIRGKTLGILGMAFKGDSDDPRDSLSYKLRKLALFRGAEVICSDPFIQAPDFTTLADVLERSDIVVIGAPHSEYRKLDWNGAKVVDIWGVTGAIAV